MSSNWITGHTVLESQNIWPSPIGDQLYCWSPTIASCICLRPVRKMIPTLFGTLRFQKFHLVCQDISVT